MGMLKSLVQYADPGTRVVMVQLISL